eukprot:5423523-Amphidinium_carterae.1
MLRFPEFLSFVACNPAFSLNSCWNSLCVLLRVVIHCLLLEVSSKLNTLNQAVEVKVGRLELQQLSSNMHALDSSALFKNMTSDPTPCTTIPPF